MSSERRKEQFIHACLCSAHFLPFYIVQAPNPRNGAAHWTIPYQLIKTTSWRHNLRQTIAHGDFLLRQFLHYVKFTKWSFSSPHNMFSFIVFCGYSRLYTHSCRLGTGNHRWEKMWCLSFLVWIISFYVIFSNSMHLSENSKQIFF